MNDQERSVVKTILAGAAVGARTAAQISPDPTVSGVATGAAVLLGLVTQLVENVGREKAEAILRRLVEDPAKPLTDSDLDEGVAAVRRELGI